MLNVRTTLIALGICATCVTQLQAQASWHFGIGTGLTRLNAEGVQGFHTNLFGPVEIDVDLSPDDFDDLMQSAIGGGGYAINGAWMVQFQIAQLKLGDEPTGSLPGGGQVSSDLSFDILTGELIVGRTVYRHPKGVFALRPYVGARFIKHELGADLRIDVAGTTTDVSRAIDESWTDVLVGTSVDVRLASKLTWSTRGDAGFGGSNGTFFVSSGLNWQLFRHFSLGPNARFLALDFENGARGDADWYRYDVHEFGWGVSVLYHF